MCNKENCQILMRSNQWFQRITCSQAFSGLNIGKKNMERILRQPNNISILLVSGMLKYFLAMLDFDHSEHY